MAKRGKPRRKPCAFCGGPAGTITDNALNGFGVAGYAVLCKSPTCIVGPVRSTKQVAIEAWNKRKGKE